MLPTCMSAGELAGQDKRRWVDKVAVLHDGRQRRGLGERQQRHPRDAGFGRGPRVDSNAGLSVQHQNAVGLHGHHAESFCAVSGYLPRGAWRCLVGVLKRCCLVLCLACLRACVCAQISNYRIRVNDHKTQSFVSAQVVYGKSKKTTKQRMICENIFTPGSMNNIGGQVRWCVDESVRG